MRIKCASTGAPSAHQPAHQMTINCPQLGKKTAEAGEKTLGNAERPSWRHPRIICVLCGSDFERLMYVNLRTRD
jgi:hypothetical protein